MYEEFYGKPHPAPELLSEAVYGMPELHRDNIRSARLIASPGCYPTSILLPTVPLLKAGLIKSTGIIATASAGERCGPQGGCAVFAECNESVRPTASPTPAPRDRRALSAAGEQVTIQFSPHLIPVTRGILTTQYLAPTENFKTAEEEQVLAQRLTTCLAEAYSQEPFVACWLMACCQIPSTSSNPTASISLGDSTAVPAD